MGLGRKRKEKKKREKEIRDGVEVNALADTSLLENRKAGAKCNGPPGERAHYVKGYYAAFILDADGNNIEAMYWQPLWLLALRKAPLALAGLAVGLGWWVGKNGWTAY